MKIASPLRDGLVSITVTLDLGMIKLIQNYRASALQLDWITGSRWTHVFLLSALISRMGIRVWANTCEKHLGAVIGSFLRQKRVFSTEYKYLFICQYSYHENEISLIFFENITFYLWLRRCLRSRIWQVFRVSVFLWKIFYFNLGCFWRAQKIMRRSLLLSRTNAFLI